MIPDRRALSPMMQVFRDVDRRRPVGQLLSVPSAWCYICRRGKLSTEMNRIPSTGVVSDVLDCICAACAKDNERELSKVVRIVCAGCREVVMMKEPEKEADGFVWKPGGFYHVSCCPVCAKDRNLVSSPVAERIVFYKQRGIAYD